MKNVLNPPIYPHITTKVMINHHFPRVFLWFYGFSHGFPMFFPWFFSPWIPRWIWPSLASALGRQKLLQTQRAALSGGGSEVTVATSLGEGWGITIE